MQRFFEIFFVMLIALNKPFHVLSQFTPSEGKVTLATFIQQADVYPIGRLDFDSEGLLLLSDEGRLANRIANPKARLAKRYWAEVEGTVDDGALRALERGIDLGDFVTGPARAKQIEMPTSLWPRVPPVRFRKNIPTSWLEIEIAEGKNRQVRRMTAATGFPTLRLIRVGIGALDLFKLKLAPGQSRSIAQGELGLERKA